jgi:hypothetical protein
VPSQQGWPSILAEYYGVSLDNQSVCGNSNLAILHDILKYKFLKHDVAIIMWSFTGRDLIFGEKNLFGKQGSIPVGTWQKTELATHWQATHSEADVATRSWLYIHHAQLYLTSLGIDFYFLHVDNDLKFKNLKPEWAQDVKLLDTYIGKYAATAPKAADNRHPGEHAHALTAFSIFYNIKQLNNTK